MPADILLKHKHKVANSTVDLSMFASKTFFVQMSFEIIILLALITLSTVAQSHLPEVTILGTQCVFGVCVAKSAQTLFCFAGVLLEIHGHVVNELWVFLLCCSVTNPIYF